MINKFLDSKSLTSVGSGNRAETLIHDKLPSYVFKQTELMEWLKEKW